MELVTIGPFEGNGSTAEIPEAAESNAGFWWLDVDRLLLLQSNGERWKALLPNEEWSSDGGSKQGVPSVKSSPNEVRVLVEGSTGAAVAHHTAAAQWN
jgi:hypothetical protein